MNAVTQRNPAQSFAAKTNLFGLIHKAIRFALAEMLSRLGATNYSDAAATRRTTAELRKVLTWCEKHLEHEERFVKPAAQARLPGGKVEAFEAHEGQLQVYGELRALADAVDAARDELRPVTAHALYLHFSRFVGENLAHMADEEQVVGPLLDRFLSAEELEAIHTAILRSTTPEERAISSAYVIRAVSQPERRALVGGMTRLDPPEVLILTLEGIRGAVPDADLDDLVSVLSEAAE